MFFIGSLEAASQEAFYGKARDVSKMMDCLESLRNISNLLRYSKSFKVIFPFGFALNFDCEKLEILTLTCQLVVLSFLLHVV